jgi:hypothetical protein
METTPLEVELDSTVAMGLDMALVEESVTDVGDHALEDTDFRSNP